MANPDFWLIEGDTFWHHLGVDRVACIILEGPRPMLNGYDGSQWLVRVEPMVGDLGIQTDRVLVDRHSPVRMDGENWTVHNTGVYSVKPEVPTNEIRSIHDTYGGHKMTATTDPDHAYDSSGPAS